MHAASNVASIAYMQCLCLNPNVFGRYVLHHAMTVNLVVSASWYTALLLDCQPIWQSLWQCVWVSQMQMDIQTDSHQIYLPAMQSTDMLYCTQAVNLVVSTWRYTQMLLDCHPFQYDCHSDNSIVKMYKHNLFGILVDMVLQSLANLQYWTSLRAVEYMQRQSADPFLC